MSQLSEEARLLAALRGMSLSRPRLSRNRAALSARILAGGGLGLAALGTATASAKGASWVSLGLRVVLGAALVGAVGTTTKMSAREPDIASTVRPAATVARTAATPRVAAPATMPAALASESPWIAAESLALAAGAHVTVKHRAAAVSLDRKQPEVRVDDTLAAEVQALRDAHRALKDGDAVRALALLDAAPSDQTRGGLSAEREAARIVALCAAGRIADARRHADVSLARHPSSPLSGRVRRSCIQPRLTDWDIRMP